MAIERPITLEMSPTLAEAASVLTACGLPSDDIEPDFVRHFAVAREGGVPVGLAGVQLLGDTALLRSVAVLPSHRAAGLGGRLVRAAEQHACNAGVREMFLLTNNAQQFFAGRGYLEVPRCNTPVAVQATKQFGSTCCGAATVMRKELPHE